MGHTFNRKSFLSVAALGSAGILLPNHQHLLGQVKEKPDPLDKELVKEFVIKGHGDLPAVKVLLEKQPALLAGTGEEVISKPP